MDGLKVVSGGEPEPEELAALLACFRARESAEHAETEGGPGGGEATDKASLARRARERWQGRAAKLGAKGWGWASRITRR